MWISQGVSALVLWAMATSLPGLGDLPSQGVLGFLAALWASSLPILVALRPRLQPAVQRLANLLAAASVLALGAVTALGFVTASAGCHVPCLGLLNRYFGCACGCIAEVCIFENFVATLAVTLAIGLIWSRRVGGPLTLGDERGAADVTKPQ